ncbi:MAG: class I SAM-dependent rRNA methyltransferase [bacterium]|nr:class I SAM-dependent rRNA methyltransferase [bacterium]
MEFYKRLTQKPIHLSLSKDRVRNIKRGYPWIFKHYLEELPKAASGTLAVLKDKDGEILAKGFYDPQSELSFRVLALGKENINSELLKIRILDAINLRRDLFDSLTTGFRLINGEGDLLPGLVCDLYADVAVIQFDGEGPRGFYDADNIGKFIAEELKLKCVFRKPRYNENQKGQALFGTMPSEDVLFLENGLTFSVDIINGQKTGFFLDQRDNRQRIRHLAKDKTVLNLFGYTGGFSIYAIAGNAKSVTTVDLAKPAIEAAKKNWQLNNNSSDKHDALAVDAFEFLETAKNNKKNWQVVIVDPPSFARAESSVEAATSSYHNLITSSILVTAKGGVMAASSCSSHINPAMFLELCEKAVSTSRRRAQILGIYGQPEDHPFPMSCQELRYLKFILFKLD